MSLAEQRPQHPDTNRRLWPPGSKATATIGVLALTGILAFIILRSSRISSDSSPSASSTEPWIRIARPGGAVYSREGDHSYREEQDYYANSEQLLLVQFHSRWICAWVEFPEDTYDTPHKVSDPKYVQILRDSITRDSRKWFPLTVTSPDDRSIGATYVNLQKVARVVFLKRVPETSTGTTGKSAGGKAKPEESALFFEPGNQEPAIGYVEDPLLVAKVKELIRSR